MPIKSKPQDVHFGLIPDKLIEMILLQYGIKAWSILPFFSLNKTVMDLNQRTDTSRKVLLRINRKVYFLKEFPWYCSKKSFIKTELDFMDFLHRHNFPVPHIVRTTKGNLFSTIKGKYYALFKFVDGKSWSKSKLEAYNAGMFLGNMHKLSLLYLKSHKNRMNEIGGHVFDHAKKFLNLANNYFKISFTKTKIFKEYLNFSYKLLLKSRLSAAKKGYFSLKLPIHGDFNPFNMVFSKDKDILTIMYFDNFCFDNPAHDIAEGLIRFSYLKFAKLTSNYEQVQDVYNRESATAFIKGYKKTNKEAYDNLRKYLPEACIALAIEFSALGILCGYYPQNKIYKLLHSIKKSESSTYNIMKEFK